jgi:hypothetical protein
MKRIRMSIKRSTLAVAPVVGGLSAIAGSAVDGPPQRTSSQSFQDILATQSTITFTRPSILLVRPTAESRCSGPHPAVSWCTLGIFVDGVGQLGPGLGNDFAFDSTDFGNESEFSWEGHAMQRSSNVLPPGTYTIRPQYAVVNAATFEIDDIHVTVEAVGPRPGDRTTQIFQ